MVSGLDGELNRLERRPHAAVVVLRRGAAEVVDSSGGVCMHHVRHGAAGRASLRHWGWRTPPANRQEVRLQPAGVLCI